MAKLRTANAQVAMAQAFKDILGGLPLSEKARPSLLKNALYDTKQFRVLSADQSFVLDLLDQAIARTQTPEGTRIMLFVLRMGD